MVKPIISGPRRRDQVFRVWHPENMRVPVVMGMAFHIGKIFRRQNKRLFKKGGEG
jgi:hypothetical protein